MSELRAAPDGAHPLPNGGWVVFRDPETVRQGDRKALTRRMDAAKAGGDGDFTLGLSTVDATLALSITDWSLDEPLPSADPEVLDRLPIPVYDALAECAQPYLKALFPNPSSATSPVPDGSPTGPSAA